MKRYKLPDTHFAELIYAGSKTMCSEIYKLTNSIWNKEELPQSLKKSVIAPFFYQW
jgi:hypothetical protein